ncbi:hypothetical protein [Rhodohalobacter sp.]|uniref:hypothetical protein n=1 Tax=Rhodohalobacter sp. TaxID=1974210 RepID=UPI002ACE7952|nr:hypothetical protein [Rhodohalobacter sp.]MDZ7757086.1 hypothetical protein [Rhodohalobacter sp.]
MSFDCFSQFIHRMVMFKPDARFDLAIAANPGWYTIPDSKQNYPYGILGAPTVQELHPARDISWTGG